MADANQAEIDHYATDEMICPHCGAKQDTADMRASSGEWDCEECEKPFTWEVDWSPTFYTSKPKPKPRVTEPSTTHQSAE